MNISIAGAAFWILLPTVIGRVAAGESSTKSSAPASSQQKESSAHAELWKLATLYKDDTNPILQEIKLRGRYQGQQYWLESTEGDANDWENRRSRIGFDAKLFSKTIEIRLEAQSNDGFDPFYDRLDDAFLKWRPSDDFSIAVGKLKPQIGYYDWIQSTNTQPTFERSQIFNQLRVDRAPGIVAEGSAGDWTWQAGAYSNDVDREFGGLDGGWSFGAGIGYDFKPARDIKKADWRLDWLHSDNEAGDSVMNRYQDILSTSFWLENERWSMVTEAFYAAGGNGADGNVFGIFLQPTYDLVPGKLQLVGRYSFSTGDGSDSIIAQTRYERVASALTGGGRGDTYHAAYAGLQYFIHGDNLKVLAGAEYAHLDGGGNGGDFGGTTFLAGLRISF